MKYLDHVKVALGKIVLCIVLALITVPLTVYILAHLLVCWWVEDLFDQRDHEPLVERTATLITVVIMALLTAGVVRTIYAHI